MLSIQWKLEMNKLRKQKSYCISNKEVELLNSYEQNTEIYVIVCEQNQTSAYYN